MHMIQNSRPRDMAVKNKSLPLLNICKVEKQMGHFFFFQQRNLVNQITHNWHVNALVLEYEFVGMRTFIFYYNIPLRKDTDNSLTAC